VGVVFAGVQIVYERTGSHQQVYIDTQKLRYVLKQSDKGCHMDIETMVLTEELLRCVHCNNDGV
jgi:hypothetical protein